MANPEHLAILKKGVKEWNAWREANPDIQPDLNVANLSNADLQHANLRGANLYLTLFSGANLSCAKLSGAKLYSSQLDNTNLLVAQLNGANLERSNLSGANLTAANFNNANLNKSRLNQAMISQTRFDTSIMSSASVGNTSFINVNLQNAKYIDTLIHDSPSSVDYDTIQKSWPLPLEFLRGVGFPDNWIKYFPSLLFGPDNKPIEFFTCFISYSRSDDEFAERLYADLQNKGIRCWKDTHDLPWGARTRKVIDVEIRRRDKVILILSEHSVTSDWVEHEIDLTLDEELRRKKNILIPFRIDDAVMDTDEEWAASLRSHRNFGDFRGWEDHKTYKKSFETLLKYLKSDNNPEGTQ
ncbi:toll/interleukin-1 receptor domain-containing protein [Calditrichota bacterium]